MHSESIQTPHWLEWVRREHGSHVSIADAEILYAGRMSWEVHNALCSKGDLAALIAHLALEDHPVEREVFYISSFNMTYRAHPNAAIEIARRYIDDFTREPCPFVAGSKPDHKILKQLAILYEQADEFELAIWACQVALHFGIADDGTRNGFAGRMSKLQNTKERVIRTR